MRASTAGKLLPTDSFPQSSYVRWQTTQYSDCCFVASRRVYHLVPASGSGSSGTNYDETDFGYDVMKRQVRTITPGGTISWNVLDPRGMIIAAYVGTDDAGGTDSDPTGGGTPGNNMVIVTANAYDNGTDGGDGTLTEQTQFASATDTRVTQMAYDFRNRRITIDGEIDFFQKDCVDNLNRIIQTERFDTTASGNLIAKNETRFDDRNRTYRTIRYGVDPTTGTVGNALTDNTWYDAAQHVIKVQTSGAKTFTKTAYDSLGRPTTRYRGYDLGETSYPEAGSVTDDVILQQVEAAFDSAGNQIQASVRQRYHNAPASQTGPLQDPSVAPTRTKRGQVSLFSNHRVFR